MIYSLLAAVPAGAAQEAADNDASKIEQLFDAGAGSGDFRAIKEQIQSLLKQNRELEAQYASLQQEFLDLQGNIRQSRKEIADLQQDQTRWQQRLRQKADEMLADTREGPDPAKELRRLQLYDLQCQKKELELSLQLKAAALKEDRQAYDRQLAELEKRLGESGEQHKRLAAQIGDIEKKSAALPVEIELLRHENARLEDQNKAVVEAKQVSVVKKAAQLKLASQIRVKESEKAELDRAIRKLEAELNALAAGSDNVYFSQEDMAETIKRMDQENQQLRGQLFSLRQKNAAP